MGTRVALKIEVRAICHLLLFGLWACDGRIIGSKIGAMPESQVPIARELSNGWPAFAPSESFQLRRLTSEQYLASVGALLQVDVTTVPPIEPVAPVAGFGAIGASTSVVSSGGVGQFEDAARFLAHVAFSTATTRQTILSCSPSGVNDTTCFRAFVTSFGAQAWRRPLSAEEVDRYVNLTVALATASNDALAGLEAVTSAFLQSPNFLYLTEVGELDPERPGQWRYTAYEIASRLSYFLTNRAPDDTLLAAAASGKLTTTEEIRAQAQRLLELPSARAAVRRFFSELLALNGLDALSRPVSVFPKFTPNLGAALKEQTLKTLEDLVFDRNADFREVFDQDVTFINDTLATFYDLPSPGSGAAFSRVKLSDARRVGLLGQAGVLAVHDHPDGTSPTKRGLFVLTRLLCQPLALSPPPDLVIPQPPMGVLTARQRLQEHSVNAVCASCHRQMDSAGLSLEKFDALGVYRDTDHALPIDDSGLLGTKTYAGEPGLASLLKQEPATGPCLIQSLYGAGVGHAPTESDRATFARLVSMFEASQYRVRDLLIEMAFSEGFRTTHPAN